MSILRFTTARDVFEAFPAARQDIVAAPSGEPVLTFLDGLVAKPALRDALAYCAYILPRREAVWWACRCIQHAAAAASPAEEQALAAAEAWVEDPSEDLRLAAMDAGMAGDRSHAATWAALAAAWSGGNFFRSENRFAHPPRPATAKAALGAAMLAAGWETPQSTERNFRDFIDICRDIVAGSGS